MDYSESKDISAMCEVYKAEVEALRKALREHGDWSDKGEKVNVNTDRTESTIGLIEKVEELTKWLDMKTEYIATLEERLRKTTQERDSYYSALMSINYETPALGGSDKDIERALFNIDHICDLVLTSREMEFANGER